MKYPEILEYSNIATVPDAESSRAARMPQTYWSLLNNLNGLPGKSMWVGLNPRIQSISPLHFVKTAAPRCHGWGKVEKRSSSQRAHWIPTQG